MKKVISCMICALLLVGCMAGCGSTGGKSGSGNGIKIMMSLSQGDDFRNTIVEQAKKTAQEKGATLDVYDEDGSLESQVEHIKQAAKEKYDVILCGPVNADTALELESLADGIPVIFYNSCPDASYLETGRRRSRLGATRTGSRSKRHRADDKRDDPLEVYLKFGSGNIDTFHL